MDGLRYQVRDWPERLANEPVRVWSEVDRDNLEVRKIEIYADHSVDVAAAVGDKLYQTGSSQLTALPIPSPEEVASPTTGAEFEAAWLAAMSDSRVRARLSEVSGMESWVEMSAQVRLTLDDEREKSLGGDKNRSVIFSFRDAHPQAGQAPVNLTVEFSTVDGAELHPGQTAQNVAARFLGPLWMVSVVVAGAHFSLWMGEAIGTGSVQKIVANPPYGRHR